MSWTFLSTGLILHSTRFLVFPKRKATATAETWSVALRWRDSSVTWHSMHNARWFLRVRSHPHIIIIIIIVAVDSCSSCWFLEKQLVRQKWVESLLDFAHVWTYKKQQIVIKERYGKGIESLFEGALPFLIYCSFFSILRYGNRSVPRHSDYLRERVSRIWESKAQWCDKSRSRSWRLRGFCSAFPGSNGMGIGSRPQCLFFILFLLRHRMRLSRTWMCGLCAPTALIG